MRTTLGICTRKKRYPSRESAEQVARNAVVTLRPYRCDLCKRYHLTGRTKGMRVVRPPDRDSPSPPI